MRTALAVLATAAVVAACGARTENGADGKGVDAPGVLVFSGLPAGSYLHSLPPSGTGLAEVELPKTCSPWDFTRDGRVLRCYEWSGPWGTYAMERRGATWDRVPLPREWKFPAWVASGMEDAGDFAIDAPEWAPAGDRLAFIRRSPAPSGGIWFSSTGNVAVADPEGTQERAVAKDGEVPTWSPDGTSLAFARCRVSEANLTDENSTDSAECSLWVVPADERKGPQKLAEDADSAPVWSPDGSYIAYFRAARPCSVDRVVCKRRIYVVSAKGGKPQPVGPELTEPSELFWLPESAPAADVASDHKPDDPLDLQRCVDIWNRARMQWPSSVANVRLVKGGCQITVAGIRAEGLLSAGFECWQSVPYSFQCPSHGGSLRTMNPAQRVWNAQADAGGRLTLVDTPKGPLLPLPKAPPYPILNGYILPFGSDGNPLRGLTFSETRTGTCMGRGWMDYPDSVRCFWREGENSYLDNYCFKAAGPLRVGDIALCADRAGATSFLRLKLSKVDERLG